MGQLMLMVKYQTKPQTRTSFVDAVESAGILEKIYQEDGFISYRYYYDAADPDCLLLIEEWESEKQQQAHLQTEHMRMLKDIKEKYVLETSVRKL